MLAYLTRRVEAAREGGADCIVLRFDSPGGTIYHGRKIGDMLFDAVDMEWHRIRVPPRPDCPVCGDA